MGIILPDLTDYQRAIIGSPARFTITEASTKVGKTFSHTVWLFSKAHEEGIRHLGRNYWWVAPVYSQAKIAFNRLRNNVAHTGLYTFNESNLTIQLPNGGVMQFKTAEKPDNLYGEDVYAAVFDEAPRARPEAWYALRSTLTHTQAPCKLIGNFGGVSNWVHKLKEKSESDPQYAYFKVTCWDAVKAGLLKEEEVLQAKRDLPPRVFSELYLAEASEDDGQLITNAAIRNLFSRRNIADGPSYITADIARLGADKTVIGVWRGLKCVSVKTLHTSTVDTTVREITKLVQANNVRIDNVIVDEDGVGGGVKDYLKCRGFINNSRPVKIKGYEENFANLKSQCYWKLADAINYGDLAIDIRDIEVEGLITEELEWVRLSKEIDTSKISMMPKDKIKSVLGRSPDYADMLMMRMYFELRPNAGVYAIK